MRKHCFGCSVYRWQGKIENEHETLLIIKTLKKRFLDVRSRLEMLHPYEVPEIIGFGTEAVSKKYFKWLVETVQKTGKEEKII